MRMLGRALKVLSSLVILLIAISLNTAWLSESYTQAFKSIPIIHPASNDRLVQMDALKFPSGSQWEGAVVIPRHPAWIAFEGVDWVWSYAGAEMNAGENESAIFSIHFDIPDRTSVSAATLEIAVDNFLDELSINGIIQPDIKLVDPYSFAYITSFEITPSNFFQGSNSINITTRNESGPAGAAFRLTILLTDQNVSTPSPTITFTPTITITPTFTPTPVSKEHIKKEFNLDLLDGKDASWTEREIKLVYDVFKSLPEKFSERLTCLINLQRLKAKGSSYGSFNCKDEIKLYDQANKAKDFKDDPNGDKQFKGTLLHELTHAFLAYKEKGKLFKDVYDNPLMKDYIKAINNGERSGKGWQYDATNLSWKFNGTKEKPPTDYGQSENPEEDLCESVMFYIIDPENLEKISITRYDYIKKHLFSGKEYKK